MAARTPRILLVEDDMAYARLTALRLEEWLGAGIEVVTVPTLARALDRLGDADCVVTDLGLPDAHGVPVVRALRAAGAAAVVVLSGRDDAGLGAELWRAGACAHVVKGDEAGALADAIRQALVARAH